MKFGWGFTTSLRTGKTYKTFECYGYFGRLCHHLVWNTNLFCWLYFGFVYLSAWTQLTITSKNTNKSCMRVVLSKMVAEDSNDSFHLKSLLYHVTFTISPNILLGQSGDWFMCKFLDFIFFAKNRFKEIKQLPFSKNGHSLGKHSAVVFPYSLNKSYKHL